MKKLVILKINLESMIGMEWLVLGVKNIKIKKFFKMEDLHFIV